MPNDNSPQVSRKSLILTLGSGEILGPRKTSCAYCARCDRWFRSSGVSPLTQITNCVFHTAQFIFSGNIDSQSVRGLDSFITGSDRTRLSSVCRL